MASVQRPRGTRDFKAEEMAKRRAVEADIRSVCRRFAFREIATPTFEESELFVMKSGPDILDEIYSFKDKGGRGIALRPELTAPVLRFYVNELQNEPKPLKLYYFGNCFRYERPQSGRYREFFQLGVEIIGAPLLQGDAEVLALAKTITDSLGLKDTVMRIGHLGLIKSVLIKIGVSDDRAPDVRRLIDKGDIDGLSLLLDEMGIEEGEKLRLLELITLKGGPEILDKALKTAPEASEAISYLRGLVGMLSAYGITDVKIEPGVARGLDYYTGMVFEIDSPNLGAEKQVCGGGSYRLAELFGGEPVDATGFAFGFDRLMLSLENAGLTPAPEPKAVFVIPVKISAEKALELVTKLRNGGLDADVDLMGRNISKCMKYANSRGYPYAMIVGERELNEGKVTLRDMKTGEQKALGIEEVISTIKH